MPKPEENVTGFDQSGAHVTDARERAWEKERVARALEGDSAAFGELVERYSARIFTHLYRMLGNREDAQDLAQEAFLRAYRFLGRFDPARPFRSWLYTIATNVGLNGLRTRRRKGSTISIEGAREHGVPAVEPIARDEHGPERVARGELAEQVTAALEKLPARSAALMHLHYHEDMPIADAAAIVGMTEGAARVALHRARRTLRELLIEEKQS